MKKSLSQKIVLTFSSTLLVLLGFYSLLGFWSELSLRRVRDLSSSDIMQSSQLRARQNSRKDGGNSASDNSARESRGVLSIQYQENAYSELTEKSWLLPEQRRKSEITLSGLLRSRAENEIDPTKRIAFYCKALSHLGEALNTAPYDARLLINWANIRQMLASIDCGLPFTKGDFQQAAALAIKSRPSDFQVRYGAALLSLWSGQRSEAINLLRQVLTYGLGLPESQEEVIFSQIRKASEISQLIPGRFPQVTRFARFLQNKAPRVLDSAEVKAELTVLQLQALEKSIAEVKQGVVPLPIHLERLSELMETVASDNVRQRVDHELALHTGGVTGGRNERFSNYLKMRSELVKLSRITASIASDTRPTKTNLTGWGKNDFTYLNDFYTSIGVYIPERQTFKVLELVSDGTLSPSELNQIKLFGSSNNEDWSEVTEATKKELYLWQGRSIIAFGIPAVAYNYWKLQFSGASKERTFGGPLRTLVNAYGYSSRPLQAVEPYRQQPAQESK